MTAELTQAQEDVLDRAIEMLSEHFDHSQIICTTETESKDTYLITRGRGNMYARIGAVKDWLIKKDEETRLSAREENGD